MRNPAQHPRPAARGHSVVASVKADPALPNAPGGCQGSGGHGAGGRKRLVHRGQRMEGVIHRLPSLSPGQERTVTGLEGSSPHSSPPHPTREV